MNINRRGFLFGASAAAALAGCNTLKTGARPLKPGERRHVALIGCGIQGRGLIMDFVNDDLSPNVDVTVACDCDKTRAEFTAGEICKRQGEGTCRAELDFVKVIRDPEIDAVCIATPDHWHAYISVEAMKHGKDVYCEKPLTFSIDEAKKVMAAQEKYGRVFQTGSMQRSWDVFRTAVSIVRNGFIGDVMFVDANYGYASGEKTKLAGPSHPVRFYDKPEEAAQESEGYEQLGEWGWNRWLGPAKWRPYSNQLAPKGVNGFYPMFWRFDDDLGSGYNGDWGAHHLDIAQWGLDMDQGGPFRIIRSDEPPSANLYHGGRRPYGMKMLFKKPYGTVELYHGPFGVWGTVFYGTDGIVAVNRGKIAVWRGTGAVRPTAEIRAAIDDVSFMKDRIVAESVGKDYGTDATVKKDDRLERTLKALAEKFDLANAKVKVYESHNQVQNFCQCIETRACTISPAEVGGRGATLCLLCNMSYQYDTGFEWDPVKMDFADGNPKGLSICREKYRNGWDIVV